MVLKEVRKEGGKDMKERKESWINPRSKYLLERLAAKRGQNY